VQIEAGVGELAALAAAALEAANSDAAPMPAEAIAIDK